MVARRHRNDRNGARLAAGLAGYALGISSDAILSTNRGSHEVAKARQVAMYLAHVGFGMSLARVADAFDRDRSTVAHACHVVEDKRDDTEFDDWVETLETGLCVLAPLRSMAA